MAIVRTRASTRWKPRVFVEVQHPGAKRWEIVAIARNQAVADHLAAEQRGLSA
jgi:hypothetical protein